MCFQRLADHSEDWVCKTPSTKSLVARLGTNGVREAKLRPITAVESLVKLSSSAISLGSL